MGRARPRRPIPGLLVAVAAGLALAAWCGWVSGFHRSTTPARVTWGLTLAAVVLLDLLLWLGRTGRRPGWHLEPAGEPWPRSGQQGRAVLLGLSPWLGLALLLVAWEVLGIDTGPHRAHLTVSALAQAFRSMNALLLLAWMVVGIAYGVARARAPVGPSSRTRPQAGAEAPAFVVLAGAHLPTAAPALLLPGSRAAGVVFWIAVVVVGAFLDVVARRSAGRLATFGELVRFVATFRVLNAVLVLAWAYAGYHLFAH